MKREMRRKDRQLPPAEAWQFLEEGQYGVLSVTTPDGYPYGVPVHYVMDGDTLLFHASAVPGLKDESIAADPRASFTLLHPLEGMRCKSVIAFGTVRAVPGRRAEVLEKLVEKFVPPEGRAAARAGISAARERITAYAFTVEHLSAKVIDKPEN